ncbi:hypothetical protein LNKW23_00540 [Paralimibaculum aggregatum]|uniref:Uncharacterized protein n=1 Tax=Paralimibaculum aggregatum TaxID=3036245 RepID=A0ABQ6LGN9_9RHOB|nr:hypothetical protein LNKW23_00540 [Limibaculum sp. NKW23]
MQPGGGIIRAPAFGTRTFETVRHPAPRGAVMAPAAGPAAVGAPAPPDPAQAARRSRGAARPWGLAAIHRPGHPPGNAAVGRDGGGRSACRSGYMVETEGILRSPKATCGAARALIQAAAGMREAAVARVPGLPVIRPMDNA